MSDPNQRSQAEMNNWLVAKLYVVERLASALLGLWVSAVPSDEEVTARIAAVRSSAQAGIAALPNDVRDLASSFLAETLDQCEQNIKSRRAAISTTPRAMQ
jgi:hypothetical protein